jgi:putative YhdH/YhfP family quinone oxidoreductase
VIATSYDIGVAHDGGYAEYARVKADWVVPMPKGMSLAEAMALGTAGFTAGLAVVRMEHEGLKPGAGPVIVTGATGGVGSIAIDILAGLGHHVVALTGKEHESAYLKDLGAKEVMLRASLDLAKIKPLDKASWAGAVDNLGGDVLAWLVSTMQIGAPLAAVGLAASMELKTTVAPFILRGVSLLGVDSVNCAMPQRRRVWERLASDLKPRHLAGMTRTIPFESLPTVFDDFLKARIRGRIVVDLAAG